MSTQREPQSLKYDYRADGMYYCKSFCHTCGNEFDMFALSPVTYECPICNLGKADEIVYLDDRPRLVEKNQGLYLYRDFLAENSSERTRKALRNIGFILLASVVGYLVIAGILAL